MCFGVYPRSTATMLMVVAIMFVFTLPAGAQWNEAPIEYRETVSTVIDETPVWNWMSDTDNPRHFRDICVSPDGSMVAFTCQLDFYQNKHIYVMNADGSNVTDITGTLPAEVQEQNAKDVARLRWNDDGTRLFFFGIYYRDIYYYDVTSGTTHLAFAGIAAPDYRFPYSINAEGTQLFFKHDAGWNESLKRSIQGLFTAAVGGSAVNLVDCANLPYEYYSINLFAFLGSARTGGKAFFVWNQDYYGGHATGQWMYNGSPVLQGTLNDYCWPDQDLDNSIVSADGSRVLYEFISEHGQPFKLTYVDTNSGAITPITETTSGNGFGFQHLSYDGTKVRVGSEAHYHTVYDLNDMSMRDTHSYFFKMSTWDLSDITRDNRSYFIITRAIDTSTDRISHVDMAPVSYDKAPHVESISFSAPALYHGDESRIKVRARVSDSQGGDTIEWVILTPLVEGREETDWPMGRVPLSFPTTDTGSVYLRDDGLEGDAVAGDGVYSFNLIATRKGDYEGFNTWYTHYDLPAEVGIRVIAKDTDGNYGISDTKLLITDDVPAAPVADFTFSVLGSDLPVTVRFADASTGNISAWEWDFGDGQTSALHSPDHTYTAVGLYDVTLTVTGPGGTDTYVMEDAINIGNVGVAENNVSAFTLNAPYPNPFNPAATIEYVVPEQTAISLTIHNATGQRVAVLKEGIVTAGRHSVTWNASDMPSGLYFCTFKAGEKYSKTHRMLLLK